MSSIPAHDTDTPISKDVLYEQYWGKLKSAADIARTLDCSPSMVRSQMRRYGIPRRHATYTRHNSVSPFRGFYTNTQPEERETVATIHTDSDAEIKQGVAQYVNNHRSLVRSLPDVPFIYGAADLTHEEFHNLKDNRVIERIGEARISDAYYGRDSHDSVSLWAITQAARTAIENASEETAFAMPCSKWGQPHTGFVNDGEYLKCKVCGGRFSKQEVKEYNA